MSTKNIVDLFLNPKSVAVIGASKSPLKGGNRILNNLVLNNFKGKIYPINPNANGKVFNLDFYKSVLDVEDDIDVAIFYVPNRITPDLIAQCIQKGIKGAIIEASGFEEVGKEGIELRDKILKITDNFSKIRIVGPNCMGVTKIDADSDSEDKGGFFTSFGVMNKYKRGNIGIISQSGMLNGGYLMHLMTKYPNLGIRYSCSVGNKMDLSEIEFLEYFLEDPTVNVIAVYLESFKDPRKFIELCKKAKKIPKKTIIFIKGGKTQQGQKASLSHTGALAESSQLIDAIIKQAEIIQTYSFHEMFQYARTFSMMYDADKVLPSKGNVAMIAGSGGAGTITADLTIKYGLKFPELKKDSYQSLVKIFPEWMPPNRFALVDIWPAMEKAMMNGVNPLQVMRTTFEAVLGDDNVEGLFNMLFVSKQWQGFSRPDQLKDNIERFDKPIFFWLIGDDDEVRDLSRILSSFDVPSFWSLEEMVKNFQVLVAESKSKKL